MTAINSPSEMKTYFTTLPFDDSSTVQCKAGETRHA